MPRFAHLWLSFAGLLIVLGALPSASAQDQASDAQRTSPLDGIEALPKGAGRAEADEDRINFEAHWIEARLAQGRGDKLQALRHCQRAWRYAPGQTALLREIVALAFALKRSSEALRYAAIAAEVEASDPTLLRRLALLASSRREWRQAARLYELGEQIAARNRQPGEKPDQAALAIRLEMGRLYFLAEDFQKSAAAFAAAREALADAESSLSEEAKKALLDKPAETYALWAEAFLAVGKTDDAEVLFRQADAAQSDPAKLAYNIARVEAARGNPASARRELEEYFATKSTAAGMDPYELFAEMVAAQQRDPVQARKTVLDRFEKRYALDPGNVPLAVSLAGQYLAANQLDKAEPLLVAALAAGPNLEASRQLIEIYFRQSKLDKLLAAAAAVVESTGSLDVLGDSGAKVAAANVTMQRLIENARTRRRLRPESVAAGELFAAGLWAMQARQFAAADELLAAAALAQPEKAGTILRQWGLGMMLNEQYPRAAKAFSQLINRQPEASELPSAYYYLSGALELAGQTEAALDAAKQAVELQPDDPRMAARAAWILFHARKSGEAKAAYLDFLQKFDQSKGDGDAREVVREARLVLSTLEQQAGDWLAAAECLEQVLDEFPHDAGASNDLGYLWAEHGVHLNRAQKLIELAVQQAPANQAYRDSLGWVLFRQGKFAESAAELAKAATSSKADGAIFEHYGDVLEKLGRTEQARAAWQRAAAAFQKDGAVDKLERVDSKLKEPKNQRTKEP